MPDYTSSSKKTVSSTEIVTLRWSKSGRWWTRKCGGASESSRTPTTIVATLTSRTRAQPHPTEVLVHVPEGGLTVDSLILFRQFRAVDRARLVRHMGALRPAIMAALDRALMITLGLIEL